MTEQSSFHRDTVFVGYGRRKGFSAGGGISVLSSGRTIHRTVRVASCSSRPVSPTPTARLMQQSPAPSSTAVVAHIGLFVALGIFTLVFLTVLIRAMRARAANGEDVKSSRGIWLVSLVANFFD